MGGVIDAKFNSDGSQIITFCRNGIILINDAMTDKIITKYRIPCETSISSMALSPDNKRIVSASWKGTITIWASESGKHICSMSCCSNEGIGKAHVEFSPNGRHLISSFDDGTVKVWDVNTGEQLGKSLDGVYATFSCDGGLIAIANRESVSVLEFGTYQQICKLYYCENGFERIDSVAFSPDKKYIAYAFSEDYDEGGIIANIVIADILSGNQIERYRQFESINSLSFSPDGEYLVSTSNDKIIMIWNFKSLQSLIDQTRKQFIDFSLTDVEKKKYYLV